MQRENTAYLRVRDLNANNIKPGDKVKFVSGEVQKIVNGQLHKYGKVVKGTVVEIIK